MPKFSPSQGCGCCSTTLIPGWLLYHDEVSPKLHYYGFESNDCTGISPLESYQLLFFYSSGEYPNFRYNICTPQSGFSAYKSGYMDCTVIDIPLTGVYEENTWIKPLRINEIKYYSSIYPDFSSSQTGHFVFDETLPFCGVGSHYCTHYDFSGSLRKVGELLQYTSAISMIGYRCSTNTGDYYEITINSSGDPTGLGSGLNITVVMSGNIVPYDTSPTYSGIRTNFMSSNYFNNYSTIFSGVGCLYENGFVSCCESEYSSVSIAPMNDSPRFASRSLPLDYPIIGISSSFFSNIQLCECRCNTSGDSPYSGAPNIRFSPIIRHSLNFAFGTTPVTQINPVEGYMDIRCPTTITIPPSGSGVLLSISNYPFVHPESGLTTYYMPNPITSGTIGYVPPEFTFSCISNGTDGYSHTPEINQYYSCPPHFIGELSGHTFQYLYKYSGYRRPMIIKYPVLAWLQFGYADSRVDGYISGSYYCDNIADYICLDNYSNTVQNVREGLFLARADTIDINRHIFEDFNKNDFILYSDPASSSNDYSYFYSEDINCTDPGTVTSVTNSDYILNVIPATLDNFEFISPIAGGSDLCIPE